MVTVAAQLSAAESKVGTVTLNLVNAASGRAVTTEVWYPAQASAQTTDFRPRPLFKTFEIAPNASPDRSRERLPLIVLSHGNWGTRYANAWLATALVKAGYVVISTTHPGTSADDQTAAGRVRLLDRASDVTFALTQFLADPAWMPLVDPKRIGFAGHSFGGNTAVLLAGGRYDTVAQLAACRAAPEPPDLYCKGSKDEDTSTVKLDGQGANYADPRFKAFYVMATGPGQGFESASLRAISVPMLFDTAEQDGVLAPGPNSTWLAAAIPKAREIKRNVGHFAYVLVCRPIIGSVLARGLGLPLCDDPSGTDRAADQERIRADAVQFFNAELRLESKSL